MAARYSIKRGLYQLGPAGFPFEKFVAHIFIKKNYDVLVDQIVPGFCVLHEVDVVATNNHERILIECKFHNIQGPDSNVKVPLYVKARFEDIQKKWESAPAQYKKFDVITLVTNTSFTQDAITYATCANIRLLGWDYPDKENLSDLIQQYRLYPITCLTSLTLYQKAWLIREGLVLYSDIVKAEPSKFDQFGLSKDKIQSILEEAKMLLESKIS
jgi:hypothetical protein